MTKTYQVRHYGSVVLPRGFCELCQESAFVISGCYQCCGAPIEESRLGKIKRESITSHKRKKLPLGLRRDTLYRQQNQCFYCRSTFGEIIRRRKSGRDYRLIAHFDHFVPWKITSDDSEINIIAACSACNLIKSSKVFSSVSNARRHIFARWSKKYEDAPFCNTTRNWDLTTEEYERFKFREVTSEELAEIERSEGGDL